MILAVCNGVGMKLMVAAVYEKERKITKERERGRGEKKREGEYINYSNRGIIFLMNLI